MQSCALTGGIAVELHCCRAAGKPSPRVLSDVDFVAPAFEFIPETLADDYLFRHVHPGAAAGQTMLQIVDAYAGLRIDVFRASQATLSRTSVFEFPCGPVRIVSAVDLLARHTRLLLSLAEEIPVASKHARDFVRLLDIVIIRDALVAWPDHRRPDHPENFADAIALVRELMKSRRDLLITPQFSKDMHQSCPRCTSHGRFQPCDPAVALEVLGYC